jgi:hypothetical protein
MQVRDLLERAAPGIEVVGSTYPLSPGRAAAAKAVGAAQLAGFGLVLLGDRGFEAAGLPAPEWVQRLQQNKPTSAVRRAPAGRAPACTPHRPLRAAPPAAAPAPPRPRPRVPPPGPRPPPLTPRPPTPPPRPTPKPARRVAGGQHGRLQRVLHRRL